MAVSRLLVLPWVLGAVLLCSASRIQSQDFTYKLQLRSQVNGLRVVTDIPGGTVASFASKGDFQVDAPSTPGGRFAVTETGPVGIGIASPSSQLHVRVPASPNPISAIAVDVGTFGTSGNAQASHFFRVRDVYAFSGSSFLIRGDGNVGIGTDAPAHTLTVAGTIQSTAGGFRFPDGSAQTSASGVTYSKICSNFINLTGSPQSICHLNLPVGTYLLRLTGVFQNSSNDLNNSRLADCTFTGESVHYGNDIAGAQLNPAYSSLTFESVLPVSSGGIDVNCSSPLTGISVHGRRLTATQLNGSVVVQ